VLRGIERAATVGVVEHGNSAVLVTMASHEIVDRRTVDLTHGLPTHPHHHEGSWAVGRYRDSPWARDISLPEAVALVERVRAAAAQGACDSLEALAAAVPIPIASIALRECPALPRTVEALAAAAKARGWHVHWYDRETVFDAAAAALGREDLGEFLQALGRGVGPPWQAKHKLAAAAAIAAGVSGRRE
jgi:hypothetical protein